jgi:DNA-binding NarL/FixJ family response regulator
VADAIRVLVVDDHAVVREGLRTFLGLQDGIEVVAEAGDGEEGVRAAEQHRPDVVLMDLVMPRLDGVGAMRELRRRLPSARVIVLTSFLDDERLLPAIQAGAAGYLLKDIDPGRLPHALRGVVAGETALPRELVGKLVGEFDARARRRGILRGRKRPAELTEREWEVLDQLHAGHATAEIAERLGITPVTVRRHVSQIMRKLRVTDRKEALRLLDRGDAD